MCGIAGLIKADPQDRLESQVRAMADTLSHRGPDDCGVWVDANAGIALAHRRLSILDLSPSGHQPMHSACGRYVIVFNGEIYNWSELRSMLESAGQAFRWRGHSDTEVLLTAIGAWGLSIALSRARGMFSFALWDRSEQSLYLARDRVGEKPLYYGMAGNAFVFGSELKALRALSHWQANIDPEALALFLRYGYVPAPRSIYRGIFKLSPGTFLQIRRDGSYGAPVQWWQFEKLAVAQARNTLPMHESQAINALDQVLGDAVAEQMVADVPIGALLSGGLDSSTIVALMQARSSRPVRTFTIGFSEGSYDEVRHARAVANHLGADHTELYVSPEEARAVIPRLPDMYDEPFGDSSQIPTFLACALTRQHVTVCLSGDAGDELFGGYNRYYWATSVWRRAVRTPAGLRRLIAASISMIPAAAWNSVFKAIGPLLPGRLRVSNPGDKLHKLAEVIGAESPELLYRLLVSQWRGPLPLRQIAEPVTLASDFLSWPTLPTFAEQMMAVDTLTYLPDDILVKVDRAAMASSLETRVPFLDKRVVEFAWRLPFEMKIRNGQGKWLLKQLLYRYVPRKLVERPKQGFAIPIEHWLRGPLRDWAENLLSAENLARDGLIDPAPVRSLWKMHLGGRNVQYALWNVLMYQAWRQRWH